MLAPTPIPFAVLVLAPLLIAGISVLVTTMVMAARHQRALHDADAIAAGLQRDARDATARADRLQGELDKATGSASDLATTLNEATNSLSSSKAVLEERTTALATASEAISALQADIEAQRARIEELVGTAKTLEEQHASSRRERDDLAEAAAVATRRIEALQDELKTTCTQLATAQATLKAETEAHAATKGFLESAPAQLRSAFLEAASKVFDEKAIVLDQKIKATGEASRLGLEATLKPLSDSMVTFQQRLEQLSRDASQERQQLVGSLGEMKTLNQHMAEATSGLSRALKGNAKARGDWGELILETVLKASGLEEGANYLRQAESKDEDGQRQRPDVVVLLPEGRKVVVDAKVNLVAWAEYHNADTPEAEAEALVRHTAALRQHVKDLAAKNYPASIGADSIDFTVLFVPIEGALSAALTFNADIQIEAFRKKILFTSPNTLMGMLRVVERLWNRDKVQKQVAHIQEEAQKLMDALTRFFEEFDQLGQRVEATGKAYAQAKNRLTDSNQSVAARGRRLVEAGAKGTRALHPDLQPDETLPLLIQELS